MKIIDLNWQHAVSSECTSARTHLRSCHSCLAVCVPSQLTSTPPPPPPKSFCVKNNTSCTELSSTEMLNRQARMQRQRNWYQLQCRYCSDLHTLHRGHSSLRIFNSHCFFKVLSPGEKVKRQFVFWIISAVIFVQPGIQQCLLPLVFKIRALPACRLAAITPVQK